MCLPRTMMLRSCGQTTRTGDRPANSPTFCSRTISPAAILVAMVDRRAVSSSPLFISEQSRVSASSAARLLSMMTLSLPAMVTVRLTAFSRPLGTIVRTQPRIEHRLLHDRTRKSKNSLLVARHRSSPFEQPYIDDDEHDRCIR